MRRSKSITLTTLGAALTGGCAAEPTTPKEPVAASVPAPAPAANPIPANGVDFTWYDKDGNEVPENWVVADDGTRTPDPHPHDNKGRAWVRDENGELIPLDAAIPNPAPAATTSTGGIAMGGGSTNPHMGHSPTYHRSPLIVPIFLGSLGGGRPGGALGFTNRPATGARPPGVTTGGFGSVGGATGGAAGA